VLNHTDDDQVFAPLVPQSPGRKEDINDDPQIWYPKFAQPTPLFAGHVSDLAGSAEAREVTVQIGETGVSYGPRPASGLFLERRVVDKKDIAGVLHPVVGSESLPLDPLAMGSEVLGEATDPNRDLRAIRAQIRRLAIEKSMHFGWNVCRNGAGAFGMNVTVVASAGQARYIFNPTIGEGGIAQTVNGPGMEIPVRYCGFGRETQVRAYLYFYAWMTAGTGTGSFWIANRNDSGGMTGFSPVNSGPTVSGTTPQWYPGLGAFDPLTAPNFYLNANPAYDADNVVLGGMKSGSADLMVGAWAIVVRNHG
jgi:hypothetical protein